MADEWVPGSVIARRYRLERRLDQGGMGVVWAASHLVTKRAVAIKFLHGASVTDKRSRARMMREARASCAIAHPSIVPVEDVVDAAGAPALVMELLQGESLRTRLDRGALDETEVRSILAPVAAALAAAHAVGIVHRDVKPENIFLVRDKDDNVSVKVLDFGVAKVSSTDAASTALTESGAMLGTPYYMAPEQAFGERDVGPAVDAWALGVVLHECITGARLFQADNLGQVIKLITQAPIPSLRDKVPTVALDLVELTERLLERDPEGRLRDLATVAAGLNLESARAARASAAPVVSLRRGRRAFAAAIGLGAIVLALAAGSVVLGRPRPAKGTVDDAQSGAVASVAVTPSAITAASAPTRVDMSARVSVSAPPPPAAALAIPLRPQRGPEQARSAAVPGSADPTPASMPSQGPGRVITVVPF